MDGNRFDDLTRGVANRRGLLKGLGGAAAGFVGLRVSAALAACRPGNYACQRNSDCCSGVCYYPSKTARSRVCCTADPISVTCPNNFCGTTTNNCGATVTCGCGDLDCCSGSCVDLSSDPSNCGSCGNVCEDGTCENYSCLSGPGAPCQTSEECQFFCACGSNDLAGFCDGDYFADFTSDLGGWTGDIVLGSGVGVVSATDAGAFTRFGGYTSEFPLHGWKNGLTVYLDMSLATGGGTDLRGDYTVAANQPDCSHRREFVFSMGTDPSNAGKFLVSASNNTPGWPGNPGRSPVTISQSGWYTLAHSFEDNGSGVLEVTMTLHDSSDNILGTWVLSDPTDIIGTTVGGHRYGWVLNNHIPNLQIDDSFLNYFPF